ncbi:NAD(P)/FAD-dependent oxidoreductase [Gilvimarinus chinensis]|uniref:NAD(P)/FAD-dependent oxidoreductase n=1 Tax=Gilvimarinus chinensis TaxID=396005 RepID=UPI0003710EF5|nr:FAD-dependent oxidoreductase [Gilvimarinus chinensis]
MTENKKSIAIIGSGVSGLTCAYLLCRNHSVTVFEKEQSIGGHTATKPVSTPSGDYWIDTGFIVYNDRTYPNFIKLMQQLNVAGQKTEMGFGVSCENSGYEYAGTSVGGLFAQKRNVFKVSHWRMLADIVRFNRRCTELFQRDNIDPSFTLDEFVTKEGFGKRFVNFYLLPMVSAIWSSGTETAAKMPLDFFIRFFHNHGLLTVMDQPQWYTLVGGSHSYLKPLTAPFADSIITGASIKSVVRTDSGVDILHADGTLSQFDEVVFACHSDQALALLGDPTAQEKSVLGSIPYKDNDVVLHTDASLLPDKKSAWASWNYRIPKPADDACLLTYNMNILQNIRSPETFCVTVNPGERIDEEYIHGRYRYAHPVFTKESVAAKSRWANINAQHHTHFCGAYWHNGFHEDGVVSALRVASYFGETL